MLHCIVNPSVYKSEGSFVINKSPLVAFAQRYWSMMSINDVRHTNSESILQRQIRDSEQIIARQKMPKLIILYEKLKYELDPTHIYHHVASPILLF